MLNANNISRELGLADKQEANRYGGGLIHIEPANIETEFAGDILYRKPVVSLPDNGRDRSERREAT